MSVQAATGLMAIFGIGALGWSIGGGSLGQYARRVGNEYRDRQCREYSTQWIREKRCAVKVGAFCTQCRYRIVRLRAHASPGMAVPACTSTWTPCAQHCARRWQVIVQHPRKSLGAAAPLCDLRRRASARDRAGQLQCPQPVMTGGNSESHDQRLTSCALRSVISNTH